MALRNGSLSFADMKTATPFFSDFFNTDCLVVEGVPHFSITGATKTLYGQAGGNQLERFRSQLVKVYGPKTSVTANDLGGAASLADRAAANRGALAAEGAFQPCPPLRRRLRELPCRADF